MKKILLTLLFVMLAIPVHVMQGGVQEALITISDNSTIWIDPTLSREEIVKEMFRGLWPDNYKHIYGEEK